MNSHTTGKHQWQKDTTTTHEDEGTTGRDPKSELPIDGCLGTERNGRSGGEPWVMESGSSKTGAKGRTAAVDATQGRQGGESCPACKVIARVTGRTGKVRHASYGIK